MGRGDCCPICGREIRTNVNAAVFGGKPYHFACWIGESGPAPAATPVASAAGSADRG
jgi:hypothetical protein